MFGNALRHRAGAVTLFFLSGAFTGALAPHAAAQGGTATISGTVTRQADGSRIADVIVGIPGTAITAVTGPDGRYTLYRVPAGSQTVLFRWLGYRPERATLDVVAGRTHTLDVALEAQAVMLGEIVVEGVSRTPERVVDAPAAVAVITPAVTQSMSVTGQTPLALATVAGVDVVQSGMNDFNVNARGFNSSLNRRVLVLQDGRDLAIAFLGAQEWNSLAIPLEQLGQVEMVRGPGSALYGANAFSGVVSITTPAAREVTGTKFTLAGGELSSLRGDVHHAGLLGRGRMGYRVNFGYNRSESWTASRTARDTSDFRREYSAASDSVVRPPRPGFEVRPLNGQTADSVTGVASGQPDDVVNMYGSARVDYYADNGSVVTLEGGAAQVENEVFITGIGRVQVTKALRPWTRLEWAAARYNLMAWYSGRNSIDPQYSLLSGAPLEEKSATFHVEGQYNRGFAGGQGRVVVGASFRQYNVNTDTTLMTSANDDRSDAYYAGYGQLEYRLTPQIRAVAAARVDASDLFDTQVSPKGGLVFSPNERHSIRVTVNRAFQTPNYSEFYLRVPVAAPSAGPGTLEASLEGYFATIRQNFGADPNLPATPVDIPWNFSAQTPVLALGNASLDVEKVLGWEVGYKGNLSNRFYLGVDGYINRLTDFVTDLLPAAIVRNPDYPAYELTNGGTVNIPQTLTDVDAYLASQGLPANHPLRAAIPQLQGGYAGVNAQLVQTGLLATLPDGRRAGVISYANAGNVTERGLELSAGYLLTNDLRVEGSFTLFDFDDPEGTLTGDVVLPNTPKRKGTLSISYSGAQGVDVGVTARLTAGYDWAAGVYLGYVEPTETINVSAGYRVNNNLRFHATATNVLDQQRFHLYGGSVIGRRVLAGATASF